MSVDNRAAGSMAGGLQPRWQHVRGDMIIPLSAPRSVAQFAWQGDGQGVRPLQAVASIGAISVAICAFSGAQISYGDVATTSAIAMPIAQGSVASLAGSDPGEASGLAKSTDADPSIGAAPIAEPIEPAEVAPPIEPGASFKREERVSSGGIDSLREYRPSAESPLAAPPSAQASPAGSLAFPTDPAASSQVTLDRAPSSDIPVELPHQDVAEAPRTPFGTLPRIHFSAPPLARPAVETAGEAAVIGIVADYHIEDVSVGNQAEIIEEPVAPASSPDTVLADRVALAEAAIIERPYDPDAYSELGSAYLAEGRYISAGIAFGDALSLGDRGDHAILGKAMALTGQGEPGEASVFLRRYETRLSAADLGIALALAGEPVQGATILEAAVASGDNSSRVRQNLAYAYALSGRWREAQALAEVDLAPSIARARIAEWMETSREDAAPWRIARFMGIPDTGIAFEERAPTEIARNTFVPPLELRAAAGPSLADGSPAIEIDGAGLVVAFSNEPAAKPTLPSSQPVSQSQDVAAIQVATSPILAASEPAGMERSALPVSQLVSQDASTVAAALVSQPQPSTSRSWTAESGPLAAAGIADLPTDRMFIATASVPGSAASDDLPLHVSAETGVSVRLGDLLSLFEKEFDASVYAALQGSPNASEYVTASMLRDHGIALAYAEGSERAVLSHATIR